MLDADDLPTGKLKFDSVRGKTAVTTCYARYPLKFISARRAADRNCVWVYALGYGGGAVRGDHVSISCTMGEACTAAVTTQGSTKVYKRGSQAAGGDLKALDSNTGGAGQSMRCRVMQAGMLAVIPDPITCFEDASFKQDQRFMLEQGSSLVLVDWLTCGRMSRGEGWDFARFESRNEVMVQNSAIPEEECGWEPLILDSLVLEELPGLSIRERMLGMNVVGVAILLGPRVADVVSALLENEERQRSSLPLGLQSSAGVNCRSGAPGASKKTPEIQNVSDTEAPRQGGSAPGGRYLSSVSRLRGGHGGWCRGLVYRFAAERTEDARDALHNLLLPLKGLLGGKAPYATEGGTS